MSFERGADRPDEGAAQAYASTAYRNLRDAIYKANAEVGTIELMGWLHQEMEELIESLKEELDANRKDAE